MRSGNLKRTSEGGGAPLYTQLYNDLRQCIEDGQWKLGDRIPTIDLLIEIYGVSRITVRGAIERLERDGWVRRAQGKGTYVVKDVGKNRELLLPTTWQELVNHIEKLHAQVIELDAESLPGLPAAHRGRATERYWSSKRVNYTRRNSPYSITTVYLAYDIYKLNTEAFRKEAILPLLRNMPEVRLAEAYQSLTVGRADFFTADILKLDVGEPTADVRREALDDEGRLIYLAEIKYSARQLRIDTRLI